MSGGKKLMKISVVSVQEQTKEEMRSLECGEQRWRGMKSSKGSLGGGGGKRGRMLENR